MIYLINVMGLELAIDIGSFLGCSGMHAVSATNREYCQIVKSTIGIVKSLLKRYIIVAGGCAPCPPRQPVHSLLDTIEVFDTTKSLWSGALPLSQPRCDCAVVALDGSLYVIGGFRKEKVTAKCERLDLNTGRWITSSQMQVARKGVTAVAMGGFVYAIGGHTEDSKPPLALVEKFDPNLDSWETLPSLQTARRYAASAAMGGFLFVVGGDTGSSTACPSADVEKFCPVAGTWSSLPPMPTPRVGCVAGNAEGRLCVAAGTSGGAVLCHNRTLEIFDPKTKLWSTLLSMQMGSWTCAGAVLNTSVYVLGSRCTKKRTGELSGGSHMERFDLNTGTWTELPGPQTKGWFFSVAASIDTLPTERKESSGETIQRQVSEGSENLDDEDKDIEESIVPVDVETA